jgi:hypothetical protein
MSETMELELMETNAIAATTRTEIDSQVATAKQYPRTLSKVKAAMLSFATLDEETAQSCFYSLPARKGGDGKPIQGPSVRLAEIALATYQNLRAAVRIIADDGKTVTAQAVVSDIENNVTVSIETFRRVTTRDGKRYSEDMVNMTKNAACSLALRNAAFRVIPMALVKPVYDAARKVAVGDTKTLTQKRFAVVDKLKKMGAAEANIYAAVGASKIDDIDMDRLETLIGFGTAIKDGDATIEGCFPTPGATDEKPATPFKRAETPSAPMPEAAITQTPQDQLANIVCIAGHTFDDLQAYAKGMGLWESDLGGFDEIPNAIATKLVAAQKSLLTALASVKGGAK